MTERVELIKHENGVLEFILHGEDRQTVDEHFALLEEQLGIIIETENMIKAHILVNLSQIHNLPPFSYLTAQGRKLIHNHLSDRDKIHLRQAILARQDEMIVLSLAEAFVKLMPVDLEMKAFKLNQREEAIAWLLAK